MYFNGDNILDIAPSCTRLSTHEDVVEAPGMPLKPRDEGVWRPVSTTLHLGGGWWVLGSPIWALVLDAVHGAVRPTLAFSFGHETKPFVDTIRYNTIRYDTIRYDTIRYDTIRYNILDISPSCTSPSTHEDVVETPGMPLKTMGWMRG